MIRRQNFKGNELEQSLLTMILYAASSNQVRSESMQRSLRGQILFKGVQFAAVMGCLVMGRAWSMEGAGASALVALEVGDWDFCGKAIAPENADVEVEPFLQIIKMADKSNVSVGAQESGGNHQAWVSVTFPFSNGLNVTCRQDRKGQMQLNLIHSGNDMSPRSILEFESIESAFEGPSDFGEQVRRNARLVPLEVIGVLGGGEEVQFKIPDASMLGAGGLFTTVKISDKFFNGYKELMGKSLSKGDTFYGVVSRKNVLDRSSTDPTGEWRRVSGAMSRAFRNSLETFMTHPRFLSFDDISGVSADLYFLSGIVAVKESPVDGVLRTKRPPEAAMVYLWREKLSPPATQP